MEFKNSANERVKFEKKVPEQPVGWLEATLPKTVMTRLQSYIEEAKKHPVNHNSELAGNISESLVIKDKDDWFFQTTLTPLIGKFMEVYPLYSGQVDLLVENYPYSMNKFWVNFQKQHEFNPLHNHGGVFSFVIWVKIPTDWREQHALPFSANSSSPKTSDFEFHYMTMLGEISRFTYLLDKNSEGCMLLFPAKLKHTVYPFYNCDKKRISISGNIRFDISENSMKQFRSQMKGKDDQK